MVACRLCGKNAIQCGGWLERVNEKGVLGVWECRPACDVSLSSESKLLGSILGGLSEVPDDSQ